MRAGAAASDIVTTKAIVVISTTTAVVVGIASCDNEKQWRQGKCHAILEVKKTAWLLTPRGKKRVHRHLCIIDLSIQGTIRKRKSVPGIQYRYILVHISPPEETTKKSPEKLSQLLLAVKRSTCLKITYLSCHNERRLANILCSQIRLLIRGGGGGVLMMVHATVGVVVQ